MDDIDALIAHHARGSFAPPESAEVRRWREGPAAAGRAQPHPRPATDADPTCACGRPTLAVFTTRDFGDVTWCGA